LPIRLCLEPRCPNPATYRGRCKPHARDRERTTHPNKQVYNRARWRNTRRKQLHREPLCRQCGRIATDVDHITPIEQGGKVWDMANLRSLCKSCHSRTTRAAQQQGVTQ
jgi:5-methylcytosine-specific restriction protein A